MSMSLTTGQKAMIENALRLRLAELERQIAARQEGDSRPEHASTFLE
jgi:hypothetical protein